MKAYKFIVIAAVAVAFAGCDFFDSKSPSAMDAASVFSNENSTEQVIAGVYEQFGMDKSYRNRLACGYMGMDTDIEFGTKNSGRADWNIYAMTPTSGDLSTANGKDPWGYLNSAIEKCNNIIEGIEEFGNMGNAKMKYLLGEAYFLRSFCYFEMVKLWGDVPARFTPTTSETVYLPKVSRDVIFKQLLADLDEAIPYLPYPGQSTPTLRTDRVNKMFAQGLYARIVLMACGKAMRPEDGMEGTGDLGENRFSNDPDLQKSVLYPRALQYLDDAIASGYASLEDFEQYWKNQSNMDNLTAGPGHETLFVIPFSDGRGRWNFTFAVRSEGSKYAGGSTVTRGGDAGPVPTMWFNYDKNDVRRDVTCVNWRWNADNEQELVGIQKWYFGKYRYEWMEKVPYTGGNDDGIKPVVLRYADILLMAAELANETGDLASAKDYLLQVRKRAFKGHEDDAEAYVNAINSKDKMFDAIVDERAFEFCGEMTRKFDLIRWGLLKSKMIEAKTDMKALRDLTGKYAGVNGLNGDIYWQLDGDKVVVYGFNGEAVKPSGAWEKKAEYFNKIVDSKGADTGLYDALIEGIYDKDPEQYMFWPIFNTTMTNSQGKIKNDYGYDNL
jgi:hypothetical protein